MPSRYVAALGLSPCLYLLRRVVGGSSLCHSREEHRQSLCSIRVFVGPDHYGRVLSCLLVVHQPSLPTTLTVPEMIIDCGRRTRPV